MYHYLNKEINIENSFIQHMLNCIFENKEKYMVWNSLKFSFILNINIFLFSKHFFLFSLEFTSGIIFYKIYQFLLREKYLKSICTRLALVLKRYLLLIHKSS
jgi:hypothetical protein